MDAEPDNGRHAAIVADRLSKSFRLGELHSLKQTARRMFRPKAQSSTASLDALHSVDFTIWRGDAFGIVGKNGSGKSTVLQVLAGTILPTGGSLTVQGRVLPLLAVGTGFHPELTGRENVTLFASSLGVPKKMITPRIGA